MVVASGKMYDAYYFFEEWTNEDIAGYIPFMHQALARLYEEYGLPKDDPVARARFLVNNVLRFDHVERQMISEKIEKEGNPQALLKLEGFVIMGYNHLEPKPKKIPVPLSLKEILDKKT